MYGLLDEERYKDKSMHIDEKFNKLTLIYKLVGIAIRNKTGGYILNSNLGLVQIAKQMIH